MNRRAAFLTLVLFCVGTLCLGTFPARPQTVLRLPPMPDRELVVAIREAPPFSMKAADGSWEGISADLWRHVADQLHARYRFQQYDSVSDLLGAVTSAQADVGVGALTVTAERREAMDFTQPFFSTGLGVAVARSSATATWLPVLRTFLSARFLLAVAGLLVLVALVGTLVWLFERREHDAYRGAKGRGLIAGLWWSAVAMTQAGAAQDGPRSMPGRILAVVWMIASVVTIAVFIAGITSALTEKRLQGLIRNVDDLRDLRAGALAGSSTVDFLTSQRIRFQSFPTAADGLTAVRAGRLDAFVYDRPLLAWTIQQRFGELELLPITLDSQNYAFALPQQNDLRVALDIALLETLRTDWWKQTRERYLGRQSTE